MPTPGVAAGCGGSLGGGPKVLRVRARAMTASRRCWRQGTASRRERDAGAEETARLLAKLNASEQEKGRLRVEVAAARQWEDPQTAELRAEVAQCRAEFQAELDEQSRRRPVDAFMDAIKERRCSVAEPTNG